MEGMNPEPATMAIMKVNLGWPIRLSTYDVHMWFKSDNRQVEEFDGAIILGHFNDVPVAFAYRPIWSNALISFAALTMSLALVICAGSVVLASMRGRFRMRTGRCPRCAYDLAHDFRDGCPECGWRRDKAPASAP